MKPPPVVPVGPEDPFAWATLTPFSTVDGVLGTRPVARLHLVDVGQGAATLFELSCGAVLVDTGGETSRDFDSGAALQAYLDAFFERRPDLKRTIDVLVLTHPHVDHTRNAELVATRYVVKNVVTDGRTTGSGGRQQRWLQDWAREHARLETVTAEAVEAGGHTSDVIDPLQCSDVDPRFSVLWGALETKPEGWSTEAFANANNHSVVLRVDAAHASFLVSGDLEMAGMESIVAKHAGTPALDVDVWEVSHHGARNGTTPAFVSALSPQIDLIAMGAPSRQETFSAWAFGHPRKDIVAMLESGTSRRRRETKVQAGTAAKSFEPYAVRKAVYGTGWDGSVVVTASEDGRYRVQTSH